VDQLLPADLVDGGQAEFAGRVGVEALLRRIRLVAGHSGGAVHEEEVPGHLAAHHAAGGQLGAVNAAHEIRLQDPPDVLVGHVDQLATQHDAGIVDQHIDAAQLPFDPLEGTVHLRFLRHIAAVPMEPPPLILRQGLLQLLQAVGATGQADDLQTRGHQEPGTGGSDSGTGPTYNGHAILPTIHRSRIPAIN